MSTVFVLLLLEEHTVLLSTQIKDFECVWFKELENKFSIEVTALVYCT